MKWRKAAAIVAGLAVGGLWGGQAQTAHADYSLTQALASAPQGLPVTDYFVIDKTSANSANIQDTTNAKAPNTQAVALTGNTNQIGRIWTNDNTEFNLNKNTTASMWMFFDGRTSSSGDGMAFVLQNDLRGTAARTTNRLGENMGGETMGVWAPDDDSTQTTPDSMVTRAVQNSWALEFDTYMNAKPTTGTVGGALGFDADYSATAKQHIASNYPAQTSTYQMRALDSSGKTNYATMVHNGLISSTNYRLMTDGTWHHLTLTWNAKAKTMTYAYNDKDPKTGAALTGDSQTVPIDTSLIDPDNTGKARWGFTGSTGTNYENNLVVFEKVPGVVDSTSTATLMDTTLGQTVASNSTVYAGDHMKLTYDLTYQDGSQSWKAITAKLNLPGSVSFNADADGNVGTITYANGQKQAISASKLSGQSLSVLLDEDLSAANTTAKITLNGMASHAGSATTTAVASTVSNFVGSNAITTASLAGFNVVSLSSSMTLALTGDSTGTKTITSATDATVTAKATILGGSPSDVTIHPTVNGENLDNVKTTASQASSGFTYTVPADKLKAGDNSVQLYATDSLHDVSNVVTATIDYQAGTLDFGDVSQNVAYTGALTGAQQQLTPTTPWDVSVSDTRGQNQSWQLTATASPLVDGDKALAGALVYKTNTGESPLGTTSTLIARHTSDGTTAPVTDVSSDWNDRTGIFLNVNGGASAGSYNSTITWTLANAE